MFNINENFSSYPCGHDGAFPAENRRPSYSVAACALAVLALIVASEERGFRLPFLLRFPLLGGATVVLGSFLAVSSGEAQAASSSSR